MICKNCGKELSQGDKVCCFCGHTNDFSFSNEAEVNMSTNENKCCSCGTELPFNALFCHKCGKGTTATSSELFCPNCGNSISKDSQFCSFCGKTLSESATPVHPSHAKCPNCGGTVHPQAKFCSSCKADLKVNAPNMFTINSPTAQSFQQNTPPTAQPFQQNTPPTVQQYQNYYYSKHCPRCNQPVEQYHAYCPTCRTYLGSNINSSVQNSGSSMSPCAIITFIIGIFALFSFSMTFIDAWLIEYTGYDLLGMFFDKIDYVDWTSQGAFLLYAYISTIIAFIGSIFSFITSKRLSITMVWSILGIIFILIFTEFEFDSLETGPRAYLIAMILNFILSVIGYSRKNNYH